MKNVFFLFMALFFFSCQKNDILPVNDSEQASVLKSRSASSDVKVENGYLVVENLDVLDSLMRRLSSMTDMQMLAWGNAIGFESAYSYYKPYFDAFDTLETEALVKDFQQKYEDVVKFTINEEEWNVDYPFKVEDLEYVLSKDGKIKVGKTLWIYKSDRKIVILDGSLEKVEKYGDAVASVPDEEVIVYYFNRPRTRGGQESDSQYLTGENLRNSNRKYNYSLELLRHDYKDINGLNQKRRILALYQQGQKKKKLGNWRTYKTTYWTCLRNWKVYNCATFPLQAVVQRTGEIKGGIYYKIAYINNAIFPDFDIIIGHGSRGYEVGDLSYSYRQGNYPPLQETVMSISSYKSDI